MKDSRNACGRIRNNSQRVPLIRDAQKVVLIKRIVSELFGLRRDQIMKPTRIAAVVWPRQIAMAMSRKFSNCTPQSIAELFGVGDHTTVLHAVSVVDQRRQQSVDINHDLAEVEALILFHSKAFFFSRRSAQVRATAVSVGGDVLAQMELSDDLH